MVTSRLVTAQALNAESPLVEPVWDDEAAPAFAVAPDALAKRFEQVSGLPCSRHPSARWIGLQCESVREAVWMVRALIVLNVLARREGTTLFVPVNPNRDPTGAIVSGAVSRVRSLASKRLREHAAPGS